ncbi:unnamed protein product [Aureobasidium vineae]|uniref:Mitochondrial outer membrane protein OM14 C-terminal domain-containing protein n=1 Tax=Aureobasidium vineae TaxID=2773715 RepID=A0A9N8P6P8_9PEZI|nr:unnamed protein product [Aureobasidium vineae]
MSLEFLQRPNSDAGTAPVPVDSTPEPQVDTTTAPIAVPEPTPAASTQETVTTQEPSPSQEPDTATEEPAPAPAPAPPATMSYASVAASGPQQSDEEHTDDEVHELIDVDSPHISSVPSDFQSQEIQTETQAERERLESEAREEAQKKAQQAEELKEKAKQKAQKATEKAKANSDNPVVLGNTVAVVALGGLLGFGAYRKYTAGELTWKVAGAWAGIVGVFALGDYYASKFLFKKYPPKN